MAKLPRITINLTKLAENFQTVQRHCRDTGIHLNVVVKGLAGDQRAVEFLREAGMTELGDSRLENLQRFQSYAGLNKLQLRLPALSTAAVTVEVADASLNAELATLQALNVYAGSQTRKHRVFLMVDQGDLREGVAEADLFRLADECRKLIHLEVIGLGANFSCFAGVMPTVG
ncbi:MAG TPA: alanine racemase, partial [Bacillota bacterium]|nr:alanine racemase [Bacillota bacterium]